MIDPRTLKEGDYVEFNGVEIRILYIHNFFIETERYKDARYDVIDFDSPLWQIAELKKHKLPDLPFLNTTEEGRYNNGSGFSFTPKEVLLSLKSQIAKLEAAGVKETE